MAASTSDNWKGSVKYWEKLAAIYSAKFDSNPYSYLYVPLADAQMNLGQVDKAINTLEYGLALMPGSRAAKVLLAQLYYDAGQVGKAKNLLVEVVGRWPDVLAAVSLLCRIYEKEGDIISARAISRKVSYYYPDSPFVQKMADSYESMIEKETEAAEAPAEAEKQEKMDNDFTDIQAEDPVGFQASCESASRSDDSRNGGAMTGKKRKALVALESMLDRITRIRNERTV